METYTDAYNQAVKYLGLRSHTVFELRNKLLKKKFQQKDVERVLAELLDQKYLNDADFARVFVQNLARYKTFGYFGIKLRLRKRGIGDELAEQVLAEELTIGQETKIAEKAAAKSGKKDRLKLMQMLQRKGFRGQVIGAVAGEYDDN